MTTTTSNAHAAYRPWSVRTVVVRLSRKLTATYRIRSGRRLSQLLAVLLAAVSPWAAALPQGGQVVAGQASVSTPSANAMVVNQASDKAVLNWQSFNIGSGQSMQFVQPGAASVALNRVIGNGASSIFGSLTANGQVFLVNPSGVMFAPGAQVSVGGLVASSMDISNGDFMAGRYSFSGGGAGAVSNHGSINAAPGGYVLLAAPQVTNTGAITAEAGSVGLLAGSRVSVDTSGVGLVRFSVDAAAAQAAINNSGSITANGGQVAVLASAMGDAMSTVINQSGVIRADSAVERNGTIVLSGGATGIVNVSGELSAAGAAPGQTGGTVKVLGDKVALTGSALIDASGQAGGGTVLVGGNYQGRGPEQNATGAFVGSDVRIKADAVQNGQGGTVVVWADGSTRFHGSISARGGSQGGDGGQVETSGKEFLVAAGSVDASAARGQGGNWLLDPRDVTIANAATSGGAYASNVFAPTADNAVADRNTIQTALNGGTNVTVNTGATGTQAGNITVADAITKSAGAAANLTLTAAGSIFVNNAVSSSSNALNVALNAAGATTFSAAGALSTNGGNVTITGTGAKTLGNITTTGGTAAGNLTVGTSGAVSQLASTALAIKGATAITAGAANDVTLTNTGNDFTGNVSVVSGNNVAISDASALALGASTVSGSLALAAGGSVTQTGIVNAGTLSATLTGAASALNLGTSANNIAALGTITTPGGFTLNNGNNAVAINGAIAATNTAVSITSGTGATTFGAGGAITSGGGNVTFVSTNAAKVLGNIDTTGGAATGNLLITGTGAVSQGAVTSLKVKGTTTIAAGATNDVVLSQAGNDFTGAVITSGKNITLTDANALVLGTTTANAGGALTLAAGGSVTQTGVVTTPSLTATLTGAASALNLGTQTNKVTQLDAITTPGGFSLTNGNNAVAINGAIATTDTNVSIASGSAATTFGAGGSIGSGGGNVALTSTAAKVLGSINTTGGAGTGNLTIGSAGAVSQAAGTSLTVKGATTVTAGAANSITLNNAGNDFTGAVSATSGLNVSLTDVNALVLGTSTIAGTLGVNTSGAITQSGALAVTGAATLAAGAANDITLNTATNAFANVAVTSGNNVSLRDSNGFGLGASTVSGNLAVAAGGNITQTGVVNAATLSATLTGATSALNLGTSANNIAALGTITTPGGFTLNNDNNAVAINGAIAATNTAVSITSGTGATTFGAGGAITSSGGNVSLVNTDAAKVLGNINTTGGTLAGNLLVNGAGAVTQGAGTTLKVKGTTTIAAGATNDVVLSQAGNDFTGAVITSGKNITLTDANALVLGTTTANAGGALTLAAGGSVTQTGVVTAPSLTATLTGATSVLNLGTQTNNVAALGAITTPGGFSLTNGNNAVAINGAVATTDANVSIASGSAATTFGAAGSISSGGGNVALTGTVAKVLGNINTTGGAGTGNLTIGSAGAGAVSQLAGTSLTVKGATTITAGGANSITLNNAGNDFTGAVSVVSGLDVGLTDANALVLGTSTIAGTLGVNTAGAITQNGGVTVGGATTLAAGAANDITLTNTSNNFASVAVTSGNNVSIRDTNALALGSSTVGGSLTVVAGGSVTQTGIVNAATLSATLTGATSALDLGTSANNIASLGAITTPGGFTLNNGNNAVAINGAIAATNTAVSITSGTGATTFGAGGAITSGGGNVTLSSTNAAKVLGNINTTGGASSAGNLLVNGAGAVTQSAGTTLKVKGTTTIAAGATNDVVLSQAGNDFTGAVITSGKNITLTDANALVLGATTANTGGALTLAAGGSITQTDVVTAPSLTATLTGATSALNLGTSANNIAALGTITTPGGFTLNNDNNAVAINGAIAATNTAVSITSGTAATTFGAGGAITSSGGNVSLVNTDAAKVLGNINTTGGTLAGNLLVNGAGAVTQGAGTTLKVKGTTTIAAGATNDVVLSQAGNDFTGAVITSGKNITLTDANALVLGTTTANAGGALTLAAGGSVTQTGVVTAPSLTATLTGATSVLNLGTQTNNVAVLGTITAPGGFTLNNDNNAVAINGAIAATNTAVSITSGTGATTFGAGGAITSGGGNVSLVNTDAAKVLGNINTTGGTLAGNLLVNGAGAVTQGAGTTLKVKGTTTIAAGATNDVVLSQAGNDFTGAVITSGKNITLTDANALVLGTTTANAGGALTLAAGGSVTQTGVVTAPSLTATLTGATSVLNLGTQTNNVAALGAITAPGGFTLANGNNAVAINGAVATTDTNVSIASGSSATTFGAAGSISSGGGNVALTGTVAKVLGNINTTGGSAAGNLTIGTAGAVSQAAGTSLAIKGATIITAGTANNVALNNAGNNFGGTVGVVTGNNVGITNSGALVLGAMTVSGTLDVGTSGAITQSGALTVTGATTLAAGAANNITLTNAGNNFSSVAVTSGNVVSIRDTNALQLGSSTVGTSLTVTAGGAISQTGAITAPLLVAKTLSATAANITLNNAANAVASVDLRARNAADTANATGAIAYTGSGAVNVAAAQSTGAVTLAAGGAITQTGAIIAGGATTITAGSANDVTLNNAGNDFVGAVSIVSGNRVGITDANALQLGTSNAATSLAVVAGGAISQTGAITTPTLSAKTLSAGTANITLTNAGNEVATVDLRARNLADTANAAGAIAYRDATGFDVAAVNTTGALTLQSNGNITQSGAVAAAALAVAGTGAGSLNLGTQANSIATLNAITAAGGFALNNGNNSTVVAGNISTTNSAVSIDTGTGTYTQNANIDVAAGSGPITVTADTVTIAANTGNNALATSGALTLKAKTAGRAMSLAGAAGFDLTAAELTAIATGATGSIVIGDAASTGTMTIGAPVTLAGKTLTLNAGSITDTGAQTITAQNLTLNANGQIGSSAANGIDVAVTNLSVNTSGNANAFVRSAGAVNLGAAGAASNVGSGTLDLTALGAITQTAGTGNITAGTLQARTLANAGAAITLNNSGNDAGTVNLQALNAAGTANAPAAIAYTDANAVTVSGINNGTGAAGGVTLAAGGTVTQTGAVNASTLAATLTGAGSALNLGTQANNVAQLNNVTTPGGFSLGNGNNAVAINGAIAATNAAVSIASGTAATSFAAGGSIASNGGDVTLTNSAAKVLGSIDTTGGSATGNLALAGPGAVSQAAGTALRIKGTAAVSAGAANNVTLANAGNDFGKVAVASGNNVTVTDSNALVLDTTTVSGRLTVSAGGAVTQSGALAASGLELTGAGSSYVLAHAGNAVTTLAANTGSLDYKQAGALTVGTVGTTDGVTATGTVKIETTGAASSLTLDKAVSSSATGDAVVLKAGSSNAAGVAGGGQLVNNVGAGGIVAASGRYLAYSGDPGATLEGVAGYNKRYNSDAAYVPAGSASTFLYRIAPTLTVTADNKTKVYGDSNPVLTGVVGGLIDGDTAAGVGVGYATTAVDRTAVAAGPVAITTSATNNENYTLALTNGALTITQRALTVTATGQNRVYDGTTAAGVTLADNRLAGDVLTANASVNFTDKNAGTGKTVNVAGIGLSGADAGNYSVNSAATTTANITPATIASVSGITAADKMQDGTTAATLSGGGAAFAGRIGADVLTVGAATGNFDTPAVGNGKRVGITGITLSGADAGNYVLLNNTAATTASITAAPANMAERTGDGRVTNGTALPVLDADEVRERAFRRAAGIQRAQAQPGAAADSPPFSVAGFPGTPAAPAAP